LYVFPTRNIVRFLINFNFLTASYLSKALYSLFMLKVPLNTKQFPVINLPWRSVLSQQPILSETIRTRKTSLLWATSRIHTVSGSVPRS